VPVIKGMSSFCDAFAKVKPTAPAMTSFTNSHSISGIETPNSTTIQFRLVQLANDFLNIMAETFASARPVEYNK
jgi:peptide/nickel transport system substrate-binding protein